MGCSSLWDVSDCCDVNEHCGRMGINQSGETEAGATPEVASPFGCSPVPPTEHPNSAWEGTQELQVYFLELSAALIVL